VQLDLRSFDNDVDAVRRATGPSDKAKVLVGHSYGGAVITALANPLSLDVRGLVYVAASAPEKDEPLVNLMTSNPTKLQVQTWVDKEGYVWAADRTNFKSVMGDDLDNEVAEVLYATQRPVHSSIFEAKVADPAWQHVRSSYVVANKDELFSPITQLALGQRIGADVSICDGGHMLPLSRPVDVARSIIQQCKLASL
jgi:pimeloyl-ACP methyl ester carboxylesterase